MQSQPRVVVVGGGISGLATAHHLHRLLGDQVRLTVVEGGPRLGGKVATQEFSGHQVDTGPDALLVRIPAMVARPIGVRPTKTAACQAKCSAH